MKNIYRRFNRSLSIPIIRKVWSKVIKQEIAETKDIFVRMCHICFFLRVNNYRVEMMTDTWKKKEKKRKTKYMKSPCRVNKIPWQSRIPRSGSNLQFSGCTEITCHWQKLEYKKVVRIRVHTLYRVAALPGFNSDVYRESKRFVT